MTVSIAVTNRPSISTPKNVPRMAKMPDDDEDVVEQRDEGGDAELDVAEPVRDPEQDAERADEDQQERLADQVGADDRRRSIVSGRCSAIGPSSAWSAVATSPSLPVVGICRRRAGRRRSGAGRPRARLGAGRGSARRADARRATRRRSRADGRARTADGAGDPARRSSSRRRRCLEALGQATPLGRDGDGARRRRRRGIGRISMKPSLADERRRRVPRERAALIWSA